MLKSKAFVRRFLGVASAVQHQTLLQHVLTISDVQMSFQLVSPTEDKRFCYNHSTPYRNKPKHIRRICFAQSHASGPHEDESINEIESRTESSVYSHNIPTFLSLRWHDPGVLSPWDSERGPSMCQHTWTPIVQMSVSLLWRLTSTVGFCPATSLQWAVVITKRSLMTTPRQSCSWNLPRMLTSIENLGPLNASPCGRQSSNVPKVL